MGLWDYLTTFGDSSFLGRYYRINRLLFLFYSLLIIGGVAFIWFVNPHVYVYSECPNSTADSCVNTVYGSDICSKPEIRDLPVCTQEKIFIDHTQEVYFLGEKPPFYIQNYTLLVIGGFLIILLLNTLFHNTHLFHKRKDDEPVVKDIFTKININLDGSGDVIENDKSVGENGEGNGGNKEIHSLDSGESVGSRDRREDESGSEGRFKDSLQSDEGVVRVGARGRFR